MKRIVLLLITLLAWQHRAVAQEVEPIQHTFTSLDEVLTYSEQASLDIIISNIRISQAEDARKASRREILDPTTSLSGSFTHFNELPVTLLPAEVFGGNPGENVELRAGVPYTTEFNQNFQIQLVNPAGWANYKLAKINAQISASNGQLTRQMLSENIADTYYAIVNLEKQSGSTREILTSADSVLEITQNKYEEGISSQQDLNSAMINRLNTENKLREIEHLIDDSYLTLKTLCNIPHEDEIRIDHSATEQSHFAAMPVALVNQLELRNVMLSKDYALQNYKKTRSTLIPSLSFFSGNSFQLNNNSFEPFSGDWARSNYLGLTLSINLPNSRTRSNMKQAKMEYQIASREVEKVQQSLQVEKERLDNNYRKARADLEMAKEIQLLSVDSYEKNFNLYTQGLIGVERLLNSYEALLNAEYATNSAMISLELAQSKIYINNQFN